jgi:ribonuclease BN (tRNA processing enzyme)
VKLTVIGSSPAWPNPGSAHAGHLVESAGASALLDCGPGVLARLREREEWPTVSAIAITHFHLDHWGDLVPWVWGSWHRAEKGDPKPELWVFRGGAEHLARIGGFIGFPDMFEKRFDLHEYDADTTFVAGGFEITPTRVPHYTLETYAFRVTDGETVLAYSGDSGPTPRLAEVARDADVFVCEATLLEGRLDGTPRGHLSVDEAVAAFEASGARRLVLTHRPSELPVPEGLELARDGLEIEIAP